MRRLPSSPSRSQALVEFEPVLLRAFDDLTAHVNREVRDAMHYALFSLEDRFCASAAWLLAPRIGIETSRIARVLCAIETLRASLAFKVRGHTSLEPPLAEAASFGLIPLAFEMALQPTHHLSAATQVQLAQVLARASSPVHVLSAMHRESRFVRAGYHSRAEIENLVREKVTPAFRAAGEMLALFLHSDAPREAQIAEWFEKLGLYVHWVDEYASRSQRPLALKHFMTTPEALDVIKSVEADLLEASRRLNIHGAAHDIIEPLAEVLKGQLQ